MDGVVQGGKVISDRPWSDELPLPPELIAAKRRLLPEELERYRVLGKDAAEAMTEVLTRARPEWTEWELAGAGAEALWRRGIEPTLTLVGGERRLPLFRHATATHDPLGSRAMLVFCGRRHGLYANLTRFVYFREPSAREEQLIEHVARIEAVAFAVSRPGTTAGAVYETITRAYMRLIGAHLAEDGDGGEWHDRVNRVLDRLGARDLLLTYYTKDRLMSPAARADWMEPDVRELP